MCSVILLKKKGTYIRLHGMVLSLIKDLFIFSQGIAGKAGPRGQRGPTVGYSKSARALQINHLLCSNGNSIPRWSCGLSSVFF